MALIKCTKCGHEISDKAKVCPKCGHITVVGEEKKNTMKTICAVICGIIIVVAMLGAFLLWHSNQSGETDSPIAANDSISNVQDVDTMQVEEAVVEECVDSVAKYW